MGVIGVQAVPLALADVLTSLQTGLIDTAYVSPLAAIAFQWFPQIEYRVDLPLVNITTALVVKNEVLAELSEDDRTSVREIASRRMRELVEQSRRDNDESRRLLADKGIRTIVLSDSQRARFEESGHQIAEALVDRLLERDLLERVRDLLDEHRSR